MKLVICEGEDDVAVVQGILAHLNIGDIRVEPYKGTGNLSAFLHSLPQRGDFTRKEVESLGVIIDADNDGHAAWRKLSDLVQRSFGVALPAPRAVAGEAPRIAGFVTAVGNAGALEDVCLEAVRTQPGYPCLEEYFRCLTEHHAGRKFGGKAKFRAWMASQADYDLRVGKAAAQGYLPWESPAFDPLREFLRAL